jgi:hypothetical protein
VQALARKRTLDLICHMAKSNERRMRSVACIGTCRPSGERASKRVRNTPTKLHQDCADVRHRPPGCSEGFGAWSPAYGSTPPSARTGARPPAPARAPGCEVEVEGECPDGAAYKGEVDDDCGQTWADVGSKGTGTKKKWW